MAKKKLDKLHPGQTVWQVMRQKMGNATMTYGALYSLVIKEVDLEKRRVLASWNGNKPTWYGESQLGSWRLEKPEPKKKIFGTSSY